MVEHRNAELEVWGSIPHGNSEFFLLSHARDKTKVTFLHFFTELETYHLSQSIYKTIFLFNALRHAMHQGLGPSPKRLENIEPSRPLFAHMALTLSHIFSVISDDYQPDEIVWFVWNFLQTHPSVRIAQLLLCLRRTNHVCKLSLCVYEIFFVWCFVILMC